MSASSELPRGITAINLVTNSGSAIVTLPAMPGVSWKIPANGITLQVFNEAAGNFGGTVIIQYGTPTITLDIGNIVFSSPAAGSWETQATSGPPGDLIFPMDTAVAIGITSAAVANEGQLLTVYAEPI